MPAVVRVRSESRTAKLLTRSPWLWWHLLSLDAATVAVVWCWFFASVFGVSFSWTTLPTLGLGTWCVYVADRLLDGWCFTDVRLLRDRHWFYLRNRKPFVTAWMAAALLLGYLILTRAQHTVRADDIALCLIGTAYFALIHGSHSRLQESLRPNPARWFPKELAVGFLFAVATAVPTWARLAGGTTNPTGRSMLAVAVLAFGSLCWLNCVAIQVWEDAEIADHRHGSLGAPSSGSSGQAAGLTSFLGQHLRGFAIAVGGATFCLACATARTGWWPSFAAVALSAALFLGLIRNSPRLSTMALRIAADAALLTPLLFLPRVH